MENLYHYRGLVRKVYDGDTITVDIDLGFHVSLSKEKFRLNRINTPEVRGPEKAEGLISRDWLRERILDKEIILVTHKDKKGKYGRWIADIWLDGVCINDELVDKGLAEYKDY
ncbi:MAG: thermonuclease family protein [Gammaproteobacteria bacterium]|nr:thermonuclease family protein [Gammaproteobacteria bacterium]MBQ0838321.1 thermonuclease family protein [Gammaproteobacteria bacterium]